MKIGRLFIFSNNLLVTRNQYLKSFLLNLQSEIRYTRLEDVRLNAIIQWFTSLFEKMCQQEKYSRKLKNIRHFGDNEQMCFSYLGVLIQKRAVSIETNEFFHPKQKLFTTQNLKMW